MKIANIDWEILHIFWTTWGISMKLSGKMWIMIILKVTKNQGVYLSSNWPPSLFRVKAWIAEASKNVATKSKLENELDLKDKNREKIKNFRQLI